MILTFFILHIYLYLVGTKNPALLLLTRVCHFTLSNLTPLSILLITSYIFLSHSISTSKVFMMSDEDMLKLNIHDHKYCENNNIYRYGNIFLTSPLDSANLDDSVNNIVSSSSRSNSNNFDYSLSTIKSNGSSLDSANLDHSLNKVIANKPYVQGFVCSLESYVEPEVNSREDYMKNIKFRYLDTKRNHAGLLSEDGWAPNEIITSQQNKLLKLLIDPMHYNPQHHDSREWG